jgi:hypothetical protein
MQPYCQDPEARKADFSEECRQHPVNLLNAKLLEPSELTKHFSSDEVTKKLERMKEAYGDE